MRFQCVSALASLIWVFAGWALTIELFEHKFLRHRALDGYLATHGYIERLQVTTVMHCGSVCSKNKDCRGFFYTMNTATCQLHSNDALPLENTNILQNSTGTIFYLEMESNDGAIFECPDNNGSWSRGMVANGSVYMYKLFTDTRVAQGDAVSLCQSAGGNLLKILTMEKLNFVINNLTECASVKDKSYWIDGTNYGVSDPFAPDAYKTTGNETVPQDIGLWDYRMPNAPRGSNCIWISTQYGYYFDDLPCDYAGPDGVYTICEKIVN